MRVLHVGCAKKPIPEFFKDYQEVRFDIDPDSKPDFVGDMMKMTMFPDASFEAIYCEHNLEHIHEHQIPLALAEFRRVLTPEGFAIIIVPDIQCLGEHISKGDLDAVMYDSDAGPIKVSDMIWGHGPHIAMGHPYMAHKFGFTQKTLANTLVKHFAKVMVGRQGTNLVAQAYVSK